MTRFRPTLSTEAPSPVGAPSSGDLLVKAEHIYRVKILLLFMLFALAHNVIRAKSLSKQTKQSLDQRPVDPDCRALCVRRLQQWPRPKCKTTRFKLIWAIPCWHFESVPNVRVLVLNWYHVDSLNPQGLEGGSWRVWWHEGRRLGANLWCQITFQS